MAGAAAHRAAPIIRARDLVTGSAGADPAGVDRAGVDRAGVDRADVDPAGGVVRIAAVSRSGQALQRPDRETRAARLAEIQAAGLVRQASEGKTDGVERSLPVAPALRPLLPQGHLRRGGTVAVAPGATSLIFALLAEASAAGFWCAAVGLPQLGLTAAAEAGIAVERFALVPYPGPDWPGVVAALLDGVDIVVVATPGPVAAPVASRLVARARQRGGVLVPVGPWVGAEVTLTMTNGLWHGLGQGRGRLRRREVEITAHGRGASARPRRVRLWLPGPLEGAGSSGRPVADRQAAGPGPIARDGSGSTTGQREFDVGRRLGLAG
ncbi:MAG TPA: hypothetical protein VF163_22180 [Micromonosporaceae bacterium]